MINLDERYQSYLTNPQKRLIIDGCRERVTGYGWHCDGNEVKGYYVTTENYKLFYNNDEQFLRMEPVRVSA